MYEGRHQAPLPRGRFVHRLLQHLALALGLLGGSLGLGVAGYRHFEHLAWLDALLNSAMLLGGMGPVNPPLSDGGKLFASAYALYAGLVFIVTAALMVTPVLHRLFHTLHWDGRG